MLNVRIVLRNISQVLLIRNEWTGLCILVGLFIGKIEVGVMTLIASILALFIADATNYSAREIEDGLAGFNPVLTAIALTLFLSDEWYSYVVIFIAIIITLPIGSAFREFLKPFSVPMLTMPYVFMSWLVLLMSFQFEFINADVTILPDKVQEITYSHHPIHIILAFLTGFSEIFLLKSIVSGGLILIGIFIASRKTGLYAIFANLIGISVVMLMGANHDQVNQGLFGYNIVLTAIALGVAFKTRINRFIAVVMGVILTIILHAGLTTLLTPFGVPVFTLPFIVATWIMLFAGSRL
ncbi:urea transporter [Staphylococcus sp. SQ8-PEA]|uniref:Urea transporter n=1 Tax=Staphylococcus marylandisciuri TaxID=2981529 RepID=A0ABT2QN52_9STAP|nr:urea transporter [Staphylococcus marylandisciuri]MCU5745402.1 urea transporter [Staphylococcus marylandisciuri]